MTIINKLSSSLGRRDEIPNEELAKQIAAKKDKKAVEELISLLSNKSKNIQNDSIKVLYEVGHIEPSLVVPYVKDFLALLDSRNNRLQWGGMMALATITPENPKLIYSSLVKIMDAANKGSVITKDQAVNILVSLCAQKQYADEVFPLLNEQLLSSLPNQFPMYAEKAMTIVTGKNKTTLLKTLQTRFGDMEKESKRARVQKLIKKLM